MKKLTILSSIIITASFYYRALIKINESKMLNFLLKIIFHLQKQYGLMIANVGGFRATFESEILY